MADLNSTTVNGTLIIKDGNDTVDVKKEIDSLIEKSLTENHNEDIFHKYKIGNIEIITGSKVMTGYGKDYVQLFGRSELQDKFGDDYISTRLSIFTMNGDDSAFPGHFYVPEIYPGDGAVYQYFTQSLSGGVRINFCMIYVYPSASV